MYTVIDLLPNIPQAYKYLSTIEKSGRYSSCSWQEKQSNLVTDLVNWSKEKYDNWLKFKDLYDKKYMGVYDYLGRSFRDGELLYSGYQSLLSENAKSEFEYFNRIVVLAIKELCND